MNQRPSITRKDFIEAFMHRGLTYDKATQSYEAVCALFSDAVVQGAKINIGNVLSITPCWRENRTVVMGFKRKRGGVVERTSRTYHLGKRIRYKVNIFRAFIRDHTLHWF